MLRQQDAHEFLTYVIDQVRLLPHPVCLKLLALKTVCLKLFALKLFALNR